MGLLSKYEHATRCKTVLLTHINPLNFYFNYANYNIRIIWMIKCLFDFDTLIW